MPRFVEIQPFIRRFSPPIEIILRGSKIKQKKTSKKNKNKKKKGVDLVKKKNLKKKSVLDFVFFFSHFEGVKSFFFFFNKFFF